MEQQQLGKQEVEVLPPHWPVLVHLAWKMLHCPCWIPSLVVVVVDRIDNYLGFGASVQGIVGFLVFEASVAKHCIPTGMEVTRLGDTKVMVQEGNQTVNMNG